MKLLVLSMLSLAYVFNVVSSEYKPVHVSQIIHRCKNGGHYRACDFLRIYIDKFYPIMCGNQGYVGTGHGSRTSHISIGQEETCKQISDALSDMEFASKMLDARFTENYFNDLSKS